MTTRSGPGLPDGIDGERLATAQVARLATVRPEGTPHVVPITFARWNDVLVTSVDSKPKRSSQLQRLRNVAASSSVSLLVDHYDVEWARLWWIRVDGTADIVDNIATPDTPGTAAAATDPAFADVRRALAAKYPQYRSGQVSPSGPAIVIRPKRWVSWSSGGD